MAYITPEDAQSWLEATKLRIDSNDELPEEPNASAYTLGKLASVFDTSIWTDDLDTPDLVKRVIAMLVAAWRYNRLYSESDSEAGNPYANKLETMANEIIDGLVAGTIVLTDETTSGPGVEGTLSFYPTDSSTLIDDEDDSGRKFSMGKVF